MEQKAEFPRPAVTSAEPPRPPNVWKWPIETVNDPDVQHLLALDWCIVGGGFFCSLSKRIKTRSNAVYGVMN